MAGFMQALRNARKKTKDNVDYGTRGKEILSILKKYDYSEGLTPEMTVDILQDLGPTFVKLGQIASTHTDMIPQEYCDALAALRSNVAPMDTETVHAQIEKHLGRPVEETFNFFDDKPLGSASIGQVHKAELADGTLVAVKVRRPGVVETVAQDFALIEKILGAADKLAPAKEGGIDLMTMIKELEETSKVELDFTNEARNLIRFYQNNEDREGVTSPQCYEDYSNDAILTEDFVSGPEVGDTEYVELLPDEERDRLANLLVDNYVEQILTDGFHHADPHSGNVLLVDDGIEWIDFGMMGYLSSKQRQTLLDLVTALVKRDYYSLKNCVLQVAHPRGPIDHGALLDMCEQMTSQFADSDLASFDTGELISTLTTNLENEGYDIEPFLTNLGRGLITVEGTVKALSPSVNIMECMTRHINLGFDPESLERMVEAFVMKGVQGADDLAGLPTKAVETLDMLQKSQLKLGGDFGLEPKTVKAVNYLVRNIVLAMLAMALFLGACVLCASGAAASKDVLVNAGYVFGTVGFALMVYVFFTVKNDK
ncbi:MAG: AarF/ABC1/UbiB kinase family protein [Atopobiaceae bacterium]|nr:AarF/ABC1/UbiB kinase family protein [Atopobiaceae bacterium]